MPPNRSEAGNSQLEDGNQPPQQQQNIQRQAVDAHVNNQQKPNPGISAHQLVGIFAGRGRGTCAVEAKVEFQPPRYE